MTDAKTQLEGVIAFHGHYCPGVTIGYRATLLALRELGVQRARDEELVAICENDACGVDAVQELGLTRVGLTGFAGGKLKAKCEVCVIVPSDSMQIIEDVHLAILHSVFRALCA